MSTQILTLEQVCTECGLPTSLKSSTPQNILSSTTAPSISPSLKLHHVLQHLVTLLTLSPSLDEMLHALTQLTVQAIEVDLCVLLLPDSTQDHLRIYTCTPDLSDKRLLVQPITIADDMWKRLCNSLAENRLSELNIHERESLNPLKNVLYETLLPVPLCVGNECIGLLNCYSHKTLHYTEENVLLLSMVASQAALAIQNRQCVEPSTQQNSISSFLDDLFSNTSVISESLRRRAEFLGCDLTKPHTVVVMEVVQISSASRSEQARLTGYRDTIRLIKRRISTKYPGSLVDGRENVLICLLCLDANLALDNVNVEINELMRQIAYEQHLSLAAGIGNLCFTVNDYSQAYTQAKIALEIGQCLKHEESSSTLFSTLGIYRYIYPFAREDSLSDSYQQQVAAIVDHDRRRKANLLDTLEAYLESGRNITKTSSQLAVHRNTLLQRLDRVQLLCNCDLEQHDCLSLLVAIKLYRLRKHA